MALPKPRNGAVLRYAYLWKTEQDAGLTEGQKDRPAAVILAHKDATTGQILVYVLPITHTPPHDPKWAVEIPPEDKQRLGLDGERSWIVCQETNRFLWPGPDLRPVLAAGEKRWEYGMLSKGTFEAAKSRFLECRAAKQVKVSSRD